MLLPPPKVLWLQDMDISSFLQCARSKHNKKKIKRTANNYTYFLSFQKKDQHATQSRTCGMGRKHWLAGQTAVVSQKSERSILFNNIYTSGANFHRQLWGHHNPEILQTKTFWVLHSTWVCHPRLSSDWVASEICRNQISSYWWEGPANLVLLWFYMGKLLR